MMLTEKNYVTNKVSINYAQWLSYFLIAFTFIDLMSARYSPDPAGSPGKDGD